MYWSYCINHTGSTTHTHSKSEYGVSGRSTTIYVIKYESTIVETIK